jgi:hypothetical protein
MQGTKKLFQMGKTRKSLSEADGFLHYPYYLWFLIFFMFRTHHVRRITSRNTNECADIRV